MKDSAYYAHRSQELAENQKASVTIVSLNVDRYLSFRDENKGNSRKNICFMEKKIVKCNEGY